MACGGPLLWDSPTSLIQQKLRWLNRNLSPYLSKYVFKVVRRSIPKAINIPRGGAGLVFLTRNKGIFFGYSTSSKAYRVFNKNSLIVEESIHVVFNESIAKPKDLDEEDDKIEASNKDIHQNEQSEDVEGLENNQELVDIEPIDPTLLRD